MRKQGASRAGVHPVLDDKARHRSHPVQHVVVVVSACQLGDPRA